MSYCFKLVAVVLHNPPESFIAQERTPLHLTGVRVLVQTLSQSERHHFTCLGPEIIHLHTSRIQLILFNTNSIKNTTMSLTLTQSPPIDLSESEGFLLDSFCIPKACAEDLHSVLIPGGLLKDRIKRLALDIATDYKDEPFTAICILRGGYEFFTALLNDIREIYRLSDFSNVNRLTKHIRIEFVRMTSYQDDKSVKMEITGIENLKKVKGKNVLVIEDVIDTGRSMATFFEQLNQFEPKSARLACLSVKVKPTVLNFQPQYVGFIVPDKFVVGCNYEYNNYYRDLNHVCTLTEAAKAKYSTENKQEN